MKVDRIKDPLYKDPYLGIFHLPSSHLLRPPRVSVVRGLGLGFRGQGSGLTRTPQWPFNGALMVLNSGYLGYMRG